MMRLQVLLEILQVYTQILSNRLNSRDIYGLIMRGDFLPVLGKLPRLCIDQHW